LLAGEKSFPQTTKIQENTNHQIVTTFAEKSNKQDKTTYVIKSGNKDKDYQYTPEVDHATIISMGLNNIISTYGPQE
jgi:sulfur transfer protein SufE